MNKYSKALGLVIGLSISLGLSAEEQPVPGDIVEFNCQEFKEKAKVCESYTCQTPYNQDPTVKTEWKIIEKKGNRCLISNTTDDMGLKDTSGKPKPITKKLLPTMPAASTLTRRANVSGCCVAMGRAPDIFYIFAA